ncbi:MAG: hypothetical protein ACK4L4_18590 [Gemmobacter sp.]
MGALVAAVAFAVLALTMFATNDPAPADDNAKAAVPAVLSRIYAAYTLDAEEDIYDALAAAADGPLVESLYLEKRSAQVAADTEDGETQILSVEVYEISPLTDAGQFRVAWRVVAKVRHATHVHERMNLYEADLQVAQLDGVWKLTSFRVDTATRSDELDFVGGE